MRIEIPIESLLRSIWDAIGLSDKEQEAEFQKLEENLTSLFTEFIQASKARKEEMEKEIERTESDIYENIKKFGLDTEFTPKSGIPLRERLSEAQSQLELILSTTEKQREEYEEAFKRYSDGCDSLEITDRGEFREIGNDYRMDKLDRLEGKLMDIERRVEEKRSKMEPLVNELNKLKFELGEPRIAVPTILSDRMYNELAEEKEALEKEYQTKCLEYQALARKILCLEDALGIDGDDTYSTVDLRQMDEMEKRLQMLEIEKQNNTSAMFEFYKRRIFELWDELHIPVPTQSEFPFAYSSTANRRTLLALESEVMRLQAMEESVRPILELLKERDELTNGCRMSNTNPKRLITRKSGTATVLMEEERARKKYNDCVPRIDEKLCSLLKEYENTYGERFMWNGEDLLSELQQTQKALRTQKTLRKQVRRVPLNERAPFQLQSFMI